MTSPPPAASRRWLFGPWSDLLLGCGGAYGIAFAAQSFAPATMREIFPLWLFPFVTLVLGAPHYGATLLRAYGTQDARRRYAALGIWLTALMLIAYAWGVRSPLVGSAIITLYLAWSPWHYSGQNYGVTMTFLRRRGVPVSPWARRWVHGSFIWSYVLTFLALFGPLRSGYAPASYDGTIYRLLPIGLPPTASSVAFTVCAVLYAACVVGAAVLLLRGAPRVRDLAPVAVLACTQALWFAGPTVARQWSIGVGLDPFSPGNAAYTFLWVAAGHFAQYLWITSYYAGATRGPWSLATYLGKALLVGSLAWTLPAIVFAPGLLGALPYDMGLGLLTAATVNLHHFVLDGAIWKLRDGRIARVLLLAEPAEESFSPLDARIARWGRPLVLGIGAVCVGVSLVGFLESEFGARRAMERGDFGRMLVAADRAARLGRASPRFEIQLARVAAEKGDRQEAARHLQKSISLWPTAEAWSELANLYEQGNQWREAVDAREQAAALAPEDAGIHYRLGLARMRTGDTRGARDAFARAVELAPAESLPRRSLERAEALLAKAAPERDAVARDDGS